MLGEKKTWEPMTTKKNRSRWYLKGVSTQRKEVKVKMIGSGQGKHTNEKKDKQKNW